MSDDKKEPSKTVDDYIDENLKRVFSTLEDEDLPDRFKVLLGKLRAQDSETQSDE